MKCLLMLMIFNTIISQGTAAGSATGSATGSTTGSATGSTTGSATGSATATLADASQRSKQSSSMKRGTFQPKNFTSSSVIQTDNITVSNRTSGPVINVTEWLPKQLPVWPSMYPSLLIMAANALALNTTGDNTTIFKSETRPKLLPKSAVTTPIREILTQTVKVLQNIKDFKDIYLHNATIIMSDIPSYLEVLFDGYSAGLRQATSDMVQLHTLINELDKDMVTDVKYLISKGDEQVTRWNETLNSNNFFTQKLPLFMNVSQTYDALMTKTLTSLNQTRRTLNDSLSGYKTKIKQRYDQLWNDTMALANQTQVDLNMAESAIQQFAGAIRTRNPQFANVFELQFNATCNPSFDLLDASERLINDHLRSLPIRTDRRIDESSIDFDNKFNEIKSQLLGVEFELKRGLDCVSTIKNDYYTGLSNWANEKLTGDKSLKTSLLAGFISAKSLTEKTCTEVGAQTTSLFGLTSVATSLTSTAAFGVFAETGINMMNELSMAFLGRASVQVFKIPLNLGMMSQEAVQFGYSYNAFLLSPETPYQRRLVPTLADKVENQSQTSFEIKVGQIEPPTCATVQPVYDTLDLSSTVSNSGVMLPMCYPAGFATDNYAPSVVPYNGGSFAVDVLIDNMILSNTPEVSVFLFIDGLKTIQPVIFRPNPKELSGNPPPRNYLDRMNGNNNFIRATSIKATPGGLTVSIQVSDVDQFSALMRRANARHYLQLSVFANEKPFA